MKKLYYPAIFSPEEVGYCVTVPDLAGCVTQGDTLEDAMEMVRDAVGLWLDASAEIPVASNPATLTVPGGGFVALVEFDPLAYQKKHNNRAVKKTLSIPAWLNAIAEDAHLNFSRVLQEALQEKLGLEDSSDKS